MFKSLNAFLMLRGILAVALGIVALVWPGITILTVVIVFAVAAFIAAGLQAVLAVNSTTGGRVAAHLLLGLADLTAGVIALAWPGPTVLVLVLIVACWALFAGLLGVIVSVRADELAGWRTGFIMGGVGTVAFGVSLLARPTMGVVTLASLFGLTSLINGASLIRQGIKLGQKRKTPHSVVPHTKAA